MELEINTMLNWYMSNSPQPATQEEAVNRDPVWDRRIRTVRTLFQFQLDNLGD